MKTNALKLQYKCNQYIVDSLKVRPITDYNTLDADFIRIMLQCAFSHNAST